jgi:beta-lactamase regulating signal transducer with metallopeptidase domain
MHLLSLMGELALTVPAAWTWLCSMAAEFAQDAGSTVIASIWQGAVIVCGLEIVLRFLPRISAAHRFAIWASGFGIAAGLPVISLIHFGASGAGEADARMTAPTHALWQIDARWGLAIAGIWVVASAIRGAGLLLHSFRLRRLWKTADPAVVSENLSAALKSVRGGRVAICTTQELDRPSVIGFFSPRILIPDWLFDRLTAGELEQIVLHEAEHLRRGDDWTNLIQKLALVVFPLNPALAWMEHRLCREREMACDEGVIRITNAPRAYAACLASLAERGLERRAEALSLGAWHKRSELVHRVHGILLRKRGMNRTAAGALLVTVGCALVAVTVEMAKAPELVAFVPAQSTIAMSPARQQQMTALLAQEANGATIALSPKYQAVSTKAILPEVHRGGRTNVAKRVAAKSSAGSADKMDASESSQLATKSEITDYRVKAGSEQQWIVLSAWEEVRTIDPAIGRDQVADYGALETASNLNAQAPAGSDQAKALHQANTRYTVTQLILRVIPANSASDSTQPPVGTVRTGWFVIQL